MVKQNTATKSAGRNSWRAWSRQLKPWHIAVAIAFLIIAYFFWSWWVSPGHRIAQFVAAVNSGSPSGLLALASDEEVTHLGLTPVKVSDILAEAAQSPGGILLIQPNTEPMSDSQYRYNRVLHYSIADRQGHLLTDSTGHTARVYVIAYNSPTGWHIALSEFLVGVSHARRGPGRYAEVSRRSGVPAEVFEPEDTSWQMLGQ